MKVKFPNKLREVREAFNNHYPSQRLSQTELARRAFTSRQTISRIENELNEPGVSLAHRIAAAFGQKRVTLQMLFPAE